MALHNSSGSAAEKAIDEVFLTPRVIDRGALEDMSATLQDLIREAAGRGESLATATSDVKALGESLREATKELKSRLEVAVRVMPTLEQRIGKAEQVLQFATDRTKLAEHVERAIESVVAERLAQVEKRAQAIIKSAEQRSLTLQNLTQSRADALAAQVDLLAASKVAEIQARVSAAESATLDRAKAASLQFEAQIADLGARLAQIERTVSAKSASVEHDIRASLTLVRDQLARCQSDVETFSKESNKAQERWHNDLSRAESRGRELSTELSQRTEQAQSAWHHEFNAAESKAKEVAASFQEGTDAARSLVADVQSKVQSNIQSKLTEFQGIAAALSRSLHDKSELAQQELAISRRELEARLTRGVEEVNAVPARLEAALADTLDEKLAAAIRTFAAREEQRQSQIALRTAPTDPAPHESALAELIARAEALNAPGDGQSLGALVARAESLRSAALDASAQFEEIRKQADMARVMLGDWINTAAGRIDRENARQASLESAIEASSSSIETARRSQEELARTLSQTIELAQQAASMLNHASASLPTPQPAPSSPRPDTLPADPAGSLAPEPAPAHHDDLPKQVRDIMGRVRDEIER